MWPVSTTGKVWNAQMGVKRRWLRRLRTLGELRTQAGVMQPLRAVKGLRNGADGPRGLLENARRREIAWVSHSLLMLCRNVAKGMVPGGRVRADTPLDWPPARLVHDRGSAAAVRPVLHVAQEGDARSSTISDWADARSGSGRSLNSVDGRGTQRSAIVSSDAIIGAHRVLCPCRYRARREGGVAQARPKISSTRHRIAHVARLVRRSARP